MPDEIDALDSALRRLEELAPTLETDLARALRAALQDKRQALLWAAGLAPEMAGERKPVTVMFADLSGFTALSEKLDAEVVRDLMNACFDCLVPVIEKYGGVVDKFIGDEIMALFGAPQAQEDDAERALRAALTLFEALEAFNARHGTDLGLHLGINSGLVIAGGLGSRGRQAYSVLGDTVNVAARLEDASQRGETYVGAQTYRLTASLFEFESLPPFHLKGKTEPQPVFRLLGMKAARGRQRGLTSVDGPLVGRSAELAQLHQALQHLQAGQGGLVFITGEAGLGKSRLLRELHRLVQNSRQELQWFEGASLSYEAGQPYGLFQHLFRQVCGLKQTDPAGWVLEKIVPRLEGFSPQGYADALQVLSGLYAIGGDGTPQGETFRNQLFKFMRDFWRRQAQRRPVILVFDDMHWSDPASVDLLLHLLSLVEQAPLLLIFGSRPDPETPGWKIKTAASQEFPLAALEISLQPLSGQECGQLISTLLTTMDIPPALQARIQAKADGNPLFIEEIVRTLIEKGVIVPDESGARWVSHLDPETIQIPDNLQSLLGARIDRLEIEERSTLQVASVIGRSFYFKILQAMLAAPLSLEQHLQHLQQVELIQEAVRHPELAYMFRHVLIQEAAYQSILHRQRRQLHRRAGETLETLFDAQQEEYAPILAYHFSAAEMPERAFHYNRLAGDMAFRLYALPEAASHYRQALELASTSSASLAEVQHVFLRYGRSLELQNQYGPAIQVYEQMLAWANQRQSPHAMLAAWTALITVYSIPGPVQDSDKASELYEQAMPLCAQLDDQATQARLLWARQVNRMYGARMRDSIPLGEQAANLARQLNLQELLAYAVQDLAFAYMAIGRLVEARQALDEARRIWQDLGSLPPLIENYSNLSYLDILTGEFEHSLQATHQAQRILQRIDNQWGYANCHTFIGLLYLARGQVDTLLENAASLMPVAEKIGHPGSILCQTEIGWMYAAIGALEEASQAMQTAEIKSHNFMPFHLPTVAGLAEVSIAGGDVAAARHFIDGGYSLNLFEILLLFDIVFYLAEIETLLAEQNLAEARRRADELLARMYQQGIVFGRATALRLKAQIEHQEHRLTAAQSLLHEACQLASDLGAHTWLWPSLALLAQVEIELGNPAAAAEARAAALASVQIIAGQISDGRLRQIFFAHTARQGIPAAENNL